MAPQTAPQSPSSSNLPPLLALPLQLKLQILSNFSDYASDPDHALALMILRRTHQSLRDIIPNPWKNARPAAKHFLAAERQHPYLFPWECYCRFDPECSLTHYSEPDLLFYPCYDCMRLIDRHDNSLNYQIANFGNDPAPWYTIEDGHATRRICDGCWDAQLLELQGHDMWGPY